MNGFHPLRHLRLGAAALGVLFLCAMTAHGQDFGAGFVNVQVTDPVGGQAMAATLFYPSSVKPDHPFQLGPYVVQARPGLPPAPGAFPLVAVSHGHAGSHLGHHDLATYLAQRGFVVASVDHAGDNYQDQSGFGTDTVMLGRPLQISALIDVALRHPLIGPRIDPGRIGAMGFSAGGYTVLLLAGAWPRFELGAAYGRRHPEDKELAGAGQAPRRHPEITSVADARVKAIFVMAPLGIFFDRQALSAVKAPVFLYAAEQDRVLLVDENAAHVRDCLPAPPVYRTIPGAGHYVFLAPTPALRDTLPDLFADAPGIDRAAIHQRICQDALGFFQQQLR